MAAWALLQLGSAVPGLVQGAQRSPEALCSVLTLQEGVPICLGFPMQSFSPG